MVSLHERTVRRFVEFQLQNSVGFRYLISRLSIHEVPLVLGISLSDLGCENYLESRKYQLDF